MILRLLYKENISVYYIPMILVNMRTGGKSNRSLWNRIKANKEDSLAWTRNQLNKPLFVRLKKPLQNLKNRINHDIQLIFPYQMNRMIIVNMKYNRRFFSTRPI